jgi:ornithine carbamoyltransferase
MSRETLAGRDFVSILDFSPEDVQRILDLAAEAKAKPAHFAKALTGRTLFMYFEKPSLRTRVTFEAGMTQCGGHAIYYTASDGKIGERESVADVARNLERWVDAAMCRTFSHQLVRDLADQSRIPIINGLTDHLHPCQALADFQTVREVKGDLEGRHLVYVGDGNNVAHSLMEAGAKTGCHVTVVTPEGFEPDADLVHACTIAAKETGARIATTHDLDAVAGADAVYTDVWASMGQEDEAAARMAKFRPYQINGDVMQNAGDDAIFMHCLPAHRGDEVTDEVADSPQSVIFPQAENRLHAQKALVLLLLGAA